MDADAEDRILAAALYPHSHLPADALLDMVSALPQERREELFAVVVGSGETGATVPAAGSSTPPTPLRWSATTAPSATCSATAC